MMPTPQALLNRLDAIGRSLEKPEHALALIGLGRFRRGEKLSAARFIQHYAVDRVLELAKLLEREIGGQEDVFANERRWRFWNF